MSPFAVDETLTHLHIVLASGNGMLYGCAAAAALLSVEEFRDPTLRGFTVWPDNGSRVTINADQVMSVEQITEAEAKSRLERGQQQQAEAEERERLARSRLAPSTIVPRAHRP